jgi:hypothetical protein
MNHRHASRVRGAVLAAALLAVLAPPTHAQFTEAPAPPAYALRNITLVRGDGSTARGQTLVVRGTRIEALAANAPIPADARILAGDSLYVYPGLIDAAGLVKFEFPRDTTDRARIRSWDPPRATQGFMPSRRVLDFMTATGSDGAELRKKGVVAVAVHPTLTEPLMSGRGTFVLLRRTATTTPQLVLQPELAPLMALRGGRGVYPSTSMAVLAWYRQTFIDAQRLTQAGTAAGPSAYDADMNVVQDLLRTQGRAYFVANDADEIRRVLALADEFRFKPVIVGGAEAWKVAAELRTRNVPVLVSLDFTRPRRWKPDEKPAEGEEPKPLEPAAAREKKQLEETYANAGRLAQAGVSVALVSGGRADLREGARKVIEYGMPEADALRALTVTPAVLLDAPELARVQAGGAATFVVSDAPLLQKDARVIYTFVEGALETGADLKKPAAARDSAGAARDSTAVNAAGSWTVEFSGAAPMPGMTMILTQDGAKLSGTMTSPQGAVPVSGSIEGSSITLTGTFTAGGQSIPIELAGTINGNEMTGALKTSFGDIDFKARRTGGRS